MSLRRFLLTLIPLLICALPASAVVIDFSEPGFAAALPNGEYEYIGVTSDGAVIDYDGMNPAGGLDEYFEINGGEGGMLTLDFDTPHIEYCDGLAFQYKEYQGDIFVSINGVNTDVENFWQLNGLSLGGANIFAFDSSGVGSMFVTGDLDNIIIGGEHIAIDNMVVSLSHVPEPASLLLISCGGILLRRNRR